MSTSNRPPLDIYAHAAYQLCWFCYLAPTFFGTPINYGCSNVPALLCHMKTSSKPCYIIYPSLWSFGLLFVFALSCDCFFIYLLELVACFFVLMHLLRFVVLSIACRPCFLVNICCFSSFCSCCCSPYPSFFVMILPINPREVISLSSATNLSGRWRLLDPMPSQRGC